MEQHPGQRIAKIRAERGYSQSQLARLAGLTAPFISQIEGGIRLQRSSWVTLQKIARALGVTVDDLLPSAPADDGSDVAVCKGFSPEDDAGHGCDEEPQA